MENEIIAKLIDAHLNSLSSRLEEYAKVCYQNALNFTASQLKEEAKQLDRLNDSLAQLVKK
jgi:hypothetical protein